MVSESSFRTGRGLRLLTDYRIRSFGFKVLRFKV